MRVYLPPPPVDNDKKRARDRAQKEVHGLIIDMLAKAMLEGDDPEHKKIGIRVLLQSKKNLDLMDRFTDKYATPVKEEALSEQLYPVRNEALIFMQSIEQQITDFIEKHPLPADAGIK